MNFFTRRYRNDTENYCPRIFADFCVTERRKKAHANGQDFKRPESLDQSGVWRDSGRVSENYDSAVRPYENQFSNLEATLLDESGNRVLSQSYAHRGPP